MKPLLTRLALWPLAGALIACATPPKKDVVWPDPPDVARIKFVQSFSQQEDLDDSAGAVFLRTLTGSQGSGAIGRPMGAAVSEDGNRLYIADYGGQALLLADFVKKTLERFAPDEDVGTPFSVALDGDENVYVSDSVGRRVVVLNRKGERVRSFGEAQALERPTGIAIDRHRKLLYLSDTASKTKKFRVAVFDLQGKYLRDVGEGSGNGDGQYNFQTYLAVDHQGFIYVADSMNFRIQVFDREGKFARKYGKVGDGLGSFSRVKGVAVDGFGNIYVADGDHEAVQIFNRDFQLLMFFGGGVNKVEYMSLPSCVAIDPKRNRIYVCQERFSRINVYDLVNTTAGDAFDKPAPPATAGN